MTGYATARQNGWMSANDIRELENMDRIPAEEGGDLYLINGNMLPLGNAGAFVDTESDRAPAKPEALWEEDEQRSERAFHTCVEMSDTELARTRKGGKPR